MKSSKNKISCLIIYLIIAGFICSANLHATDSTYTKLIHKKTIWQKVGSDIGVFFTDWGTYLTYPLHISGTEWMIGAGAIGGTALISLSDKEVHKRISRGGSEDYRHDFWDAPTAYGYFLYPGALAGGIYVIGLITGNDNLRVTGRMIGQSIIYAGTIGYALKVLTGRKRPYISDSQYKFKAFQTNEDNQSFPSGHTLIAFAVSTVLAERIGTWWSRVLFYGAAAMTGYARILNNKHWLSDAVFGGLIGFGTGWFVVHKEINREKRLKEKEKTGSGFNFNPALTGFSLSYNF